MPTLTINTSKPFTQEFKVVWPNKDTDLTQGAVCVRFWNRNKSVECFSSDSSDVTIDDACTFTLQLDPSQTAKLKGCVVFDAFAYLPDHGFTRIQKGNVTAIPSGDSE